VHRGVQSRNSQPLIAGGAGAIASPVGSQPIRILCAAWTRVNTMGGSAGYPDRRAICSKFVTASYVKTPYGAVQIVRGAADLQQQLPMRPDTVFDVVPGSAEALRIQDRVDGANGVTRPSLGSRLHAQPGVGVRHGFMSAGS